jgi:hypothetical protein
LAGPLSETLGLEEFCDETIDIAPCPRRRVAPLVLALVSGTSCVDANHAPRSGAPRSALSHRVMEPLIFDTLLQCFSFGCVHRLDHVSELLVTQAGSLSADPICEPMTIDVDSTILEVQATQSQGSGYRPLLATRADTGETLLVRFGKVESEVIKVMASGRHLIERMRHLVGEIELRQSTRCVMFGFATSVRGWTRILARSQKHITYRRSSPSSQSSGARKTTKYPVSNVVRVFACIMSSISFNTVPAPESPSSHPSATTIWSAQSTSAVKVELVREFVVHRFSSRVLRAVSASRTMYFG